MLKFLRLSKSTSTDLLTSKLYNEKTFYPSFIRDLKQSHTEVIIESPYLTVKRAYELAPVFRKLSKRGVKVRVNTREPRHHTRELQEQADQAIRIMKKVGVRVFLCSDLRHRKLAIIDGSLLWEGSLNILSQSNSCEIMRRTQSEKLVREMVRFTSLRNKYW